MTWLGPTDEKGKPLAVELMIDPGMSAFFNVWAVTGGQPAANLPGPPQRVAQGFFAPPGNSLELLVEGLLPSSILAFTGGKVDFAAELRTASGGVPTVRDVVQVHSVELDAAVDGDRDRSMEFDVAADKRRAFWFNNDNDDGVHNWDAFATTENLIPGADSLDDKIDTRRDLEDFLPYYVKLDAGLMSLVQTASKDYTVTLKFRDPHEVTRVYGLVQNIDDSRVNRHVLNVDAALRQVTQHAGQVAAPSSIGTEVKDVERARLLSAYNRAGQLEMLVEFQDKPWIGSTELVFEIEIQAPGGYQRTITSSVEFVLSRAYNYYDKFKIPLADPKVVTAVDFAHGSQAYYNTFDSSLATTALDPDTDSPDYVLLVHGWNMNDDWKMAFAETAFKRLHWQGFDGRFGAFDWATLVDGEHFLEGPLPPPLNWYGDWTEATYNVSEYQALRSGLALANLIGRLTHAGYNVHVMAHSMGNYVVAEALRIHADLRQGQQGPSTPLLKSYTAMQSALTAGAFGDDARDGAWVGPWNFPNGLDYWRHWPSGVRGDAAAPHYMLGTAGLVEQRVNLYNPTDAATAGSWYLNRSVEADGILAVGASVGFDRNAGWPHDYRAELGLFGPQRTIDRGTLYPSEVGGFQSTRGSLELGLLAPGGILRGPTAFEVLAFAAIPWAAPVGTKPVDWFSENTNVSALMQSVLSHGATSYRDRSDASNAWSGHSFQFHFDAATTDWFWDIVMDEARLRRVNH